MQKNASTANKPRITPPMRGEEMMSCLRCVD